jgi:hypothetical protein
MLRMPSADTQGVAEPVLEMLHSRVTEVGGRVESRQGRGRRFSKSLPIGAVAS